MKYSFSFSHSCRLSKALLLEESLCPAMISKDVGISYANVYESGWNLPMSMAASRGVDWADYES